MMTPDTFVSFAFEAAVVPERPASDFPYDHIQPRQNWRKAVTDVDNAAIDPQSPAKFTIDASTRIASAGSCFAQRIAESLQEYGFNYLVTEPGPEWLTDEQRVAFSYGAYSARYGNVYTTLQLLQLAQRALGQFSPEDDCWLADGCYVDPFRPSIQPGGFATPQEMRSDRDQHLAAVRDLLSRVEVFVFTLGLTETWCSTADEAAYPTCPGKKFGEFHPDRYHFRNLSVSENLEYMEGFLALLRELNPEARVLLTVSPVPLAATAEDDRHVLDATTYSKAVLRVVAEELRRRHANVEYFAAYEIVTATGNAERYFLPDKRNVASEAVQHVMTSFFRNFAGLDMATMAKHERAGSGVEFQHTPCEQEQLLALINGISTAE